MKGRVIVLGEADQPIAAALMVDGRLEDLAVRARDGSRALPGQIWRAKVTRKLPKSGAFCDLTSGESGYLREARDVRQGDQILVQVVNLPEAGKAATLTTRLLFKGPRLILTPASPGVNVSRKIGNEAERARLAELVTARLDKTSQDLGGTDTLGVIVRTSARGEEALYLERELDALLWQYQSANGSDGAKDGPISDLVLSGWLDPMPDAILLAKADAALLTKDINGEGALHIWGDDRLVERFRTTESPTLDAGVLDAVEGLRNPTVGLDGGGSMVIEATRALVAIDVNTGGDFSPAAGLKANLSAARDLPRQLRLRGLGGQGILDFAPMPKQHRKTLEEALKKAFRADPVETTLVGWTRLGLYEIQRKRERIPFSEVL